MKVNILKNNNCHVKWIHVPNLILNLRFMAFYKIYAFNIANKNFLLST